ncbi:juvenile hormone acid O-methyltransferase-like [Nylanderia fulva]|uniref:juvenile hormone acid O-methyltransferase-like n=1 Tax=Nylanderia fulva TaxID=613905 RepID=UPI0010FB72C4|nr:juvenile hormone acid O-methyltransferase-like [Nylanderia fulva]XP_029179186.1 juvenile hormone acid O-methyltransferase-like [Nylanderia fulva]
MIEYARRKYTGERIDFDILDIQAENLPEQYIGQFDHVFSYSTINSRNNVLQEIKNVSKLLKRGGCFHLTMVLAHDAFGLYNKMLNHPIYGKYFMKYVSDFHYYHVNADGYLRQLIEFQGFKIKYCQTKDIIYKSDYILPHIVFELPSIHELTPKQQQDLKDILKKKWNKMEKKFDRSSYANDPKYDPECNDLFDIVQILAYKS